MEGTKREIDMDKIGNLVSLSSHAEKSKNERNEKAAEKAAFTIFSSFRKSDTDDPDVYLAACIRVLMAYPEEVMRAVADPLTGIAGEQTFLPSIAELRASLDRRYAPILAKQRHEEEIARTREIIDAAPDRATDEQRDRAIEHWERAKAETRGSVVQSQEQARQQAEKCLSELYRESLEPRTITIGSGLGAKLDAMKARMPLESLTLAQDGRLAQGGA